MQHSWTAWRAETDEQRPSCYRRGPGLGTVKPIPAPADQGTSEPPYDFAPPSLCSLSTIPYCRGGMELAEFRGIWGSIYHQTWADDTSKCSSTTGEDVQSETAGGESPLHTAHTCGRLFLFLGGSSGPRCPCCDWNQSMVRWANQMCYENAPLS